MGYVQNTKAKQNNLTSTYVYMICANVHNHINLRQRSLGGLAAGAAGAAGKVSDAGSEFLLGHGLLGKMRHQKGSKQVLSLAAIFIKLGAEWPNWIVKKYYWTKTKLSQRVSLFHILSNHFKSCSSNPNAIGMCNKTSNRKPPSPSHTICHGLIAILFSSSFNTHPFVPIKT